MPFLVIQLGGVRKYQICGFTRGKTVPGIYDSGLIEYDGIPVPSNFLGFILPHSDMPAAVFDSYEDAQQAIGATMAYFRLHLERATGRFDRKGIESTRWAVVEVP